MLLNANPHGRKDRASCLQGNESLMGLKPTEQRRNAKDKVFQPEARRNTMLLSSCVEGKVFQEEL